MCNRRGDASRTLRHSPPTLNRQRGQHLVEPLDDTRDSNCGRGHPRELHDFSKSHTDTRLDHSRPGHRSVLRAARAGAVTIVDQQGDYPVCALCASRCASERHAEVSLRLRSPPVCRSLFSPSSFLRQDVSLPSCFFSEPLSFLPPASCAQKIPPRLKTPPVYAASRFRP